MKKIQWLVPFSILMGAPAFAEDISLLPPAVTVEQGMFASDPGGSPGENQIGVNIRAVIDEEDACDCGARFEARKAGASSWVVLGFINPSIEGDDYGDHSWTLATTTFKFNQDYEVRVKLFNREGKESDYASHAFKMVGQPSADGCQTGAVAGLVGKRVGVAANPVTILEWRPTCTADEYRIYKNGTLVGTLDGEMTSFTEKSPETDQTVTWKVEAYGGDPTGQNAYIKRCDQVLSTLNSLHVGDTGTQVASMPFCEKVGNWVYAAVEFGPWWNAYGGFQPPGGWLSGLRIGKRFNNLPVAKVNYPDGTTPTPSGNPSFPIYNGYYECLATTAGAGNTTIHPWGKTQWVCPASSLMPMPPTNPAGGAYTKYRYWINFDTLKTAPGWPVSATISF